MSAAPPGGKPTIIRTGRSGYCCAPTAAASAQPRTNDEGGTRKKKLSLFRSRVGPSAFRLSQGVLPSMPFTRHPWLITRGLQAPAHRGGDPSGDFLAHHGIAHAQLFVAVDDHPSLHQQRGNARGLEHGQIVVVVNA